jgi:hypothetical protein
MELGIVRETRFGLLVLAEGVLAAPIAKRSSVFFFTLSWGLFENPRCFGALLESLLLYKPIAFFL